jgi:NADH-quinone oxidoreductase subunit C
MTFYEIKELIISTFGQSVVIDENTTFSQPQLVIEAGGIAQVCETLLRNQKTYFDFLSCITAIDNGTASNTMDVIYNLYSIPYEHSITLKVVVKRMEEGNSGYMPQIPSLSAVYGTAIWHEREIFDFFGIRFDGHPDLRRIFLPEDWKGFPLRKDYAQEEYYRGIRIEY